VREIFLVPLRTLLTWGFLLRLVLACRGLAAGRAGGLTAGMAKCRAGKDGLPPARSGVPATRVFSLHVVQAGSARGRGRRPGLPYSVQPSW
jgi:hypothetical protein